MNVIEGITEVDPSTTIYGIYNTENLNIEDRSGTRLEY